MDSKAEKKSIVKGRQRFTLEQAAMVLFSMDKCHVIGSNGLRDHALELRVQSASQDVSVILADAKFSDETGLRISSAGPNISRDLLITAIDGLALGDVDDVVRKVKDDPTGTAALIINTKIGLELLREMCVFDDDESPGR